MKIRDINPFIRYIKMGYQNVINDWVCTYDNRLFYILEGECGFRVENGYHLLKKHTLVILRAGTPYRFENAHSMKMIVFNFDYLLEHCEKDAVMRPVALSEFSKNKILELDSFDSPKEFNDLIILNSAHTYGDELVEMVNTYNTPNLLHKEFTSAKFKLFLCHLANKLAYEISDIHSIVDDVLKYIQAHFHEKITNGDVADAIGYHSYYLNRLIKGKTGKTLHRHLMDYRLSHACDLLTANKLSINEIATACGFREFPHFCSFFKERTGTSPTDFRKRYANKI